MVSTVCRYQGFRSRPFSSCDRIRILLVLVAALVCLIGVLAIYQRSLNSPSSQMDQRQQQDQLAQLYQQQEALSRAVASLGDEVTQALAQDLAVIQSQAEAYEPDDDTERALSELAGNGGLAALAAAVAREAEWRTEQRPEGIQQLAKSVLIKAKESGSSLLFAGYLDVSQKVWGSVIAQPDEQGKPVTEVVWIRELDDGCELTNTQVDADLVQRAIQQEQKQDDRA